MKKSMSVYLRIRLSHRCVPKELLYSVSADGRGFLTLRLYGRMDGYGLHLSGDVKLGLNN